jgi:hypothetical protein
MMMMVINVMKGATEACHAGALPAGSTAMLKESATFTIVCGRGGSRGWQAL